MEGSEAAPEPQLAQRTRTSSPRPQSSRTPGQVGDVQREPHASSWNRRPETWLILSGLVVYGVSLFGLAWNEQHAICVSELYVGLHQVHQLECEDLTTALDVATRKDLVRLTCDIHSDSMRTWTPLDFVDAAEKGLSDAFKVTAYKIRQEVSMYQCVEYELPGGPGGDLLPAYDYKLEWSQTPIDSSKFKEAPSAGRACDKHNPPYPESPRTVTMKAEILKMGNFGIDEATKDQKMGGGFVMQRFTDRIHCAERVVPNVTAKHTLNGKPAILHADGTIATCNLTKAPVIGCVKVSFFQSTAVKLTVMAHVVKAKLGDLTGYKPKRLKKGQSTDILRTMPWKAKATHPWRCPPVLVDLFEEGQWDAHAMLDKALDVELSRIWGARVICFLAAVLGVRLFFQSLVKIAGDETMAGVAASALAHVTTFKVDAVHGLEVDLASSMLIVIPTSMLVVAVMWSCAGWMRAMPFVPGFAAAIFYLPRCFRWSEKKGSKTTDEAKKDD